MLSTTPLLPSSIYTHFASFSFQLIKFSSKQKNFIGLSLLPFNYLSPKKIFYFYLMGRAGLFDLETHFSFYGAYHSNPMNILIHNFLVWPMFFTSVLLFHFTPSIYNFPTGFFEHDLELNFGFVFTLMYVWYYVKLDKKAGSLAALICVVCWIGASVLGSGLGFSKSWKIVVIGQLVCWAGQFIGHGIFEKRAPSENFAQGLLMGPYFVLLELLHSAFGYEPYPGFHASVKEKIEADINQWKVTKNQKKLS